jgi:SpoVK/Ycf46/Vps4 family AAA+-type ATPase
MDGEYVPDRFNVVPGGGGDNQLWVEKYKPKSTDEVIANPMAVKKLQDWLRGWKRLEVQRAKRGEAPARGAAQKNAALLSGPPGIGKTTTAHLVAAECGYYPLEFNASDTRSKKMIKVIFQGLDVALFGSRRLLLIPFFPSDLFPSPQEHLAQSTENRGLAEFFTTVRDMSNPSVHRPPPTVCLNRALS